MEIWAIMLANKFPGMMFIVTLRQISNIDFYGLSK